MTPAMLVLEAEQKLTLEKEIVPLIQRTRNLIVKTQEDRAILAAEVKQKRELKERIEEKFHPTANKKASYAVYEAALDTEKQFYVPLDNFIKAATEVIRDFDTAETKRIRDEVNAIEEKRLQKEREDKAKREAEEKAAIEAEEKKQLEEFERLEAEKKKNLELQKAATESGNAKVAGIAAKEVAKIENKIETVKEATAEKIAEIQAKAEEMPTQKMVFTPPPAPTKKLVWKARVSNPLLACRSISEGLIPFSAVEFVKSELNDLGKNYDGKSKIAGIEFYEETNGRI